MCRLRYFLFDFFLQHSNLRLLKDKYCGGAEIIVRSVGTLIKGVWLACYLPENIFNLVIVSYVGGASLTNAAQKGCKNTCSFFFFFFSVAVPSLLQSTKLLFFAIYCNSEEMVVLSIRKMLLSIPSSIPGPALAKWCMNQLANWLS